MPDADTILRGLARVADQFLLLAGVWHLLVAAALAALARGARPTRRTAAALLLAPIASVSALAWLTANPFNAAVFAGLFALLALIAARMQPRPLARAPAWARTLGGLALAYAWVYPHFLASHHPALYLVAAPMGLLPCPTLAMVLGFGLLAQGLGSRAWALLTGAAGLFYALFGALRLGVWLDCGLLVAAAAMLTCAWRTPPAPRTRP